MKKFLTIIDGVSFYSLDGAVYFDQSWDYNDTCLQGPYQSIEQAARAAFLLSEKAG